MHENEQNVKVSEKILQNEWTAAILGTAENTDVEKRKHAALTYNEADDNEDNKTQSKWTENRVKENARCDSVISSLINLFINFCSQKRSTKKIFAPPNSWNKWFWCALNSCRPNKKIINPIRKSCSQCTTFLALFILLQFRFCLASRMFFPFDLYASLWPDALVFSIHA